MTKRLETVLRRYGQTVTLKDGREIRAFVQPVKERGKAAPFQITSLGTADDRDWIYLGRTELTVGTAVTVWDRPFTVKNCQAVWLGEEISHWWAVLSPGREQAE